MPPNDIPRRHVRVGPPKCPRCGITDCPEGFRTNGYCKPCGRLYDAEHRGLADMERRAEIRRNSYLRSKGADIPKEAPGQKAQPIKSRTCPQCNRQFTPDAESDPQIYCSTTCAYAWRKAHPSDAPRTPRPRYLELRPSDIERFWAKVNKLDEADACWEWTGGKFPNGYGQFKLRSVGPLRAHQISWVIAHGGMLPPEGYVVRHTCDNKLCINPEHLVEGTVRDNALDASARGRLAKGNQHWTHTQPEKIARGDESGRRLHPNNWPIGESHWNASVTDAVAEAILRRVLAGEMAIALAREFGVSRYTIYRIRDGEGRFQH